MERTFTYCSHIQEISRIRKDLVFLDKEWTVPKSEIRQIQLIIEELFSNIIRFAFDDSKEHQIFIRLGLRESHIEIELIDDGIPFNPLEYEKEPHTDPVTSDPGGMGITLIRAFTSNMEYWRRAEKNHLLITKSLKRK
ncbi:MAG: ATP-binding protein [Bacteroidales bacterium]|nr:ATP-binding protein [Bacteroidales bacterium]